MGEGKKKKRSSSFVNEASSWVFFCVCVCERVPGRSADKARLL